jgi:hypothetical protein
MSYRQSIKLLSNNELQLRYCAVAASIGHQVSIFFPWHEVSFLSRPFPISQGPGPASVASLPEEAENYDLLLAKQRFSPSIFRKDTSFLNFSYSYNV